MKKINVYFSDYFSIDKDLVDRYGAVNISLVNDLPLFIDPFLLFNSEDPAYQKIHAEMIRYLLFLQKKSTQYPNLTPGMRDAWFSFSEVKQTWLGFSLSGNSGCGMGKKFAGELYRGLNTIFKDFGREAVTKGLHMEKFCLISSRIGRDKISDFTTNFAKQYLLEYTQQFAEKYLSPNQCKAFHVDKVCFSWDTETWTAKSYYLPVYNGDFVLLTPKSMLTKDENFINRNDMLHNLETIAPAISDPALRFELENYFRTILRKKKKELSQHEKDTAANNLILSHPQLIDYYIRYKEENGDQAESISELKVKDAIQLFNIQVSQLIDLLRQHTDFYLTPPDAHAEAKKRLHYLKHVIEDQDGYRLFYSKGLPIKREADLQVIFRLVWYGSPLDVNREVNNGRGPVDYKISHGSKNSTLVEFKLASNSKLKQNLEHQVDVYKAACETDRAIKVILFFTEEEEQKVRKILNELKLAGSSDIILIDARNDNKTSASNVKSDPASGSPSK